MLKINTEDKENDKKEKTNNIIALFKEKETKENLNCFHVDRFDGSLLEIGRIPEIKYLNINNSNYDGKKEENSVQNNIEKRTDNDITNNEEIFGFQLIWNGVLGNDQKLLNNKKEDLNDITDPYKCIINVKENYTFAQEENSIEIWFPIETKKYQKQKERQDFVYPFRLNFEIILYLIIT